MPSEPKWMRDQNGQDSNSVQLKRWGLMVAGGALALYGVTRRSKSGLSLAAAGGLMAYRGSQVGDQPRGSQHRDRNLHAQTSFAVNCSPAQAYQFWRNFENLPKFMRNLESVRIIDERRSEWTALGPIDLHICWTAEIVDDHENERIAWRSLPESDFQIRGFVEFRPASGGRGTIVSVSVQYELPAGALGKAVATILGKDPEITIREDLRRFKALLEAGEIPTTEGQSHGPRSTLIAAMQAGYPDRRKESELEMSEQFAGERSAS
jgi:uncharacterized membrane protein